MIAQFALRLLCGISLMWVILPRDRITTGFFRIQMLVAVGLGALAALTMGQLYGEPPASAASSRLVSLSAARIACGILVALAYAGSIAWTLRRRGAGTFFVFAVAAVATGLLLVSDPLSVSQTTLRASLWIASELATSLLIGSATTGMLLGHWYLTAPTMSIDPLFRANGSLAVAALFRLAVSSVAIVLLGRSAIAGTPAVWLALRWTAGICAPLLLAVMTARILKYRNTQAATGVLFVAVIVTFIGELSATLAARELHAPL